MSDQVTDPTRAALDNALKGLESEDKSGNFEIQDQMSSFTDRDVMQIAVTPNRIDVRVLNKDGELRGTGTGTPE